MIVSLFATCLADTFYPPTLVSAVRVLRRLGCRVEFPPAQTCCGQPMFNNGFLDEARAVVRHFVDVFASAQCIVTPSGSCAAFVREHAAGLFAGEPTMQQRTAEVAARVYEFSEFLTQVLKVDFAALNLHFPHRTTYHYSCHLRGLKLGPDCMTAILRACRECEFVPLAVPEQCCGFGGSFAEKFGTLSTAITESKMADLAATGAQVCVCNDSGCGMNIGGLINRDWKRCYPAQPAPRLMHIAQVLDEAWKEISA